MGLAPKLARWSVGCCASMNAKLFLNKSLAKYENRFMFNIIFYNIYWVSILLVEFGSVLNISQLLEC